MPSKELKTTFTVDFRVASGHNAARFNLAAVHREFVLRLSKAASAPITYLPTNANSDPKPTPFQDVTEFPHTDSAHRAFFHRRESVLRNSRDLSIKITHSTLSEEPIADIKKNIIPFLQKHKIYLGGSGITNEEIVVVAWCCGAHPDMTHKQTLSDELNDALNALPFTEEQKALKQELLGDEDLPELFASKRLLGFGDGDNRVSSEVLALCCVRKYSDLLKSLLLELPPDTLPYDIVPAGFHRSASNEAYRAYLLRNNDLTLNLRGLTIVNFHPSLWEKPMPMHTNFNGNLREYFLSGDLVHTIEYTEVSVKHGRFILVVKNEHFEQVQEYLTTFCRDDLPQMVGAEYLTHYGQYPRLTFAAQGLSMQRHCQSLCEKLKKTPPTATATPGTSVNPWTRRPRLVFDLSSVEATPSDLPATDNQSYGGLSVPSVSTPAPSLGPRASASDTPSVAGTSAHKSLISTDLSTIVSHFDTAISRQEEHHKQMMEFLAKSQAVQMEQTRMMTQMFQSLVQTFPSPPSNATPAKRSAPAIREPTHRHSDLPSDTPMDEASALANPPQRGFSPPPPEEK